MATIVTSYLKAEMQNTVLGTEEWKAKVEEMGLKGQMSMVSEEHPNPIPFLRMTSNINATFKVLCPQSMPIDDFNIEPIPLQVLALVALAKAEAYFDTLTVWFRRGYPDPVIVGTKKTGQYSMENYLVAQWGTEEISLEKAEATARQMWAETFVAKLKKAISEAEGGLKNPGAYTNTHFDGEWFNLAGVSG